MNSWVKIIHHAGGRLAWKCAMPLTWSWRDFSRLVVAGDRGGWVLDEEMKDLQSCCREIGIKTVHAGWEHISKRQAVFYASQFALLQPMEKRGHQNAFAYFHGRPGEGNTEFDDVFSALKRTHEQWSRIQVSHSEMRNVVLSSGIAEDKVKTIPIAVRLNLFPVTTAEMRRECRMKLGIPQHAFVAGSFQKDGNGWGEGLEPKRIKGPDVLADTLQQSKEHIPELFVLLCGPARGYVKRRLTEAGIPFRHLFTRQYEDIAPLYHALDVCLVTSRQEGGPKAVLESLASGIPLVTTRVGQAMDLVVSGQNGFMTAVEDVEALTHAVRSVYSLTDSDRKNLLEAGRKTAEENAWARQPPLWKDFFEGMLE